MIPPPPPQGSPAGRGFFTNFSLFRRLFGEFPRKFMSFWHPYYAAGVQIVLSAYILYCLCPYCAVGIYIVLLASLLMLVLLLASLYYFWHPCCSIPSAVDAVMFPVLRIRVVYPGSRILIFTHPRSGSRILDPGSKNSYCAAHGTFRYFELCSICLREGLGRSQIL